MSYMKKIASTLAAAVASVAFALVPSVALANGTDSVPYEANATVVVAPNAPEGSELIFDLETKTFTDIVLPNGRTLKPSRGCTNNTSASGQAAERSATWSLRVLARLMAIGPAGAASTPITSQRTSVSPGKENGCT